jgi:tRNA-Thr(GGU) m(6)t(6)A37 methyltransferase TsaA
MTMSEQAESKYEVYPVGHIRRCDGRNYLEIAGAYVPALKELERFSHVQVLWWFDRCDDEICRSVTQTDQAPYEAPMLGMFACRSPVRPNPIGLTTAKIYGVDHGHGRVEIGEIDAFDGTPILDLKAYFPTCDRVREVRVPSWAAGWGEWMPEDGLGLEDG